MTKDEEAQKLATAHFEIEAGMTEIFRLQSSPDAELRPDEPIKLLEVNEFTVPLGIRPLQFGAAPDLGIHFPTVIVEVTPDEFQRILSKEWKLPNGWTVGERFAKPDRSISP